MWFGGDFAAGKIPYRVWTMNKDYENDSDTK